MTTTDELREAVARQLDPSAFHTLLSSEPSLRKREARSKADRIIRMVVERCASEANDAWLDGEPAKRIQTRLRALAPKEPAP